MKINDTEMKAPKSKSDVIAKGTVNDNAYNTWLEPYMGWTFDVIRYSRSFVYFLMDNGKPEKDITRYDRHVFDIEVIEES